MRTLQRHIMHSEHRIVCTLHYSLYFCAFLGKAGLGHLFEHPKGFVECRMCKVLSIRYAVR